MGYKQNSVSYDIEFEIMAMAYKIKLIETHCMYYNGLENKPT